MTPEFVLVYSTRVMTFYSFKAYLLRITTNWCVLEKLRVMKIQILVWIQVVCQSVGYKCGGKLCLVLCGVQFN